MYMMMNQMVKTDASGGGLRTMSERIIRNRFCTDVVGCKINIPESQVRLACSPSFWPEVVSCRIWENRPRRQNGRYNQQSQKRSRPYRDDFDGADLNDSYYDDRNDEY